MSNAPGHHAFGGRASIASQASKEFRIVVEEQEFSESLGESSLRLALPCSLGR